MSAWRDGHQRARHPALEVEREQLFVGVAQGPRVVQDERLVFHQIELLRQVQVGGVEGGVFADEDGVEAVELQRGWSAQGRVRRRFRDVERARHGRDTASHEGEIPRRAMEAGVPALLRAAQESEGGVFVRQHAFGRIHHEEKTHGGVAEIGELGGGSFTKRS